MNTKDYRLIAKVIDDTDNNGQGEDITFNKTLLIENLCNAFKKDNERFERQIFVEACYGK